MWVFLSVNVLMASAQWFTNRPQLPVLCISELVYLILCSRLLCLFKAAAAIVSAESLLPAVYQLQTDVLS